MVSLFWVGLGLYIGGIVVAACGLWAPRGGMGLRGVGAGLILGTLLYLLELRGEA